MKTAIISVNKRQFDVEAILAKNNVQRIEWYNDLVEDNASINDHDLCMVFLTVEDFVNEFNTCGSCDDFQLVNIDYSEIKDGMMCNGHEFYNLTIRFCAKTHEAERTKEEYQDMANKIYNIASTKFGTGVDVKIYGYYNDVTDYRFDIYVAGEKCRILNNIPFFCTEVGEDIKGMDYCEPEWSMDGHDIEEVEYEMDEDEWLVKSQPTAQLITPVNKQEYDQAQLDAAIELANEELAVCIGIIRNYTNVHDLYDDANKLNLIMSIDGDDADYVTVCYNSVKFDVINCSDGSGIYIAADKIQVRDENKVTIWTGVLNEEFVPGVASQDEANIYLEPDESSNDEDVDNDLQVNILADNYPLEGDGLYCYELNSKYYISVLVDQDANLFAWRLYEHNTGESKLLSSDYSCDLCENTWFNMFKTSICNFTGTVEAMIELPSTIFNHVINA